MSIATRFIHGFQSASRVHNDAYRIGGCNSAPVQRCKVGFTLGLSLLLTVAGAALAPALAQDIRVLNLMANDMVYDPVSERIYASVPSIAGPGLGNTITVIDPVTGTIGPSAFVGSEPGPLAVSDDGQFVYVGLGGANIVRRYEIATATAGLSIDLGSHQSLGPYFAADIEVLPGAPRSIAISRIRTDDVVVYDDDIMRPTTSSQFRVINRIEFSESASLLYGLNIDNTGFEVWQVSITADGATVITGQKDLIPGFGVDMEFERGVLYGTTGRAVDPDALVLIGTYAAQGPVEADATLGKVFFLTGSTLQIFDLATFKLLDSIPVGGMSGMALSLVRWGPDGLAFATSGGQIFLMSGFPPTQQNPDCTVELNQSVYVDGDAVVATSLRLANPTAQAISVQGRLWFDRPDRDPYPMPGILPAGPVELPPASDQELGPVTLATVTADLPRGRYAFDCRLIDPITGNHLALDVNPFDIQ